MCLKLNSSFLLNVSRKLFVNFAIVRRATSCDIANYACKVFSCRMHIRLYAGLSHDAEASV